MADVDIIQRQQARSMKITGDDEAYNVDVQLIDGNPSMRTFGIQAIESLRGLDPICDVWFYLGTELDSSGAGQIGDQVRIQIAPSVDKPAVFTAVDETYTLVAADVDDEETLSLNIATYLNMQPGFNSLWRAQRIQGNGVVYISARKPGGQYERPNTGDFVVTSTGTTVVTAAFDKIIRRNKITGLARDPSDPRQGQLGIQGSVVASEGDVTNRFQTVYNLKVNGSVTPVEFPINADPVEVVFLSNIVIGGTGNGIKFGQFLSKNGFLTNGILFDFKSVDIMQVRGPYVSTEDLTDLFAEDPDNFDIYIQQGGDKFIAKLEFSVPLEIRPQGEFTLDDYAKLIVQDDLVSGISTLRAVFNGFNREF